MYDLAVIGGGSAGITFGKFAPKLGAKVVIIEAHKLGGDCTWTGCVPSKTLIHAARAAHTIRTAHQYGIHAPEPEIDFAAVTAHVREIQEQVYEHDDSPEALKAAGSDVILGRARFVNADELEVNGSIIRARAFCIATGSTPRVPPIEGIKAAGFITNEDVFHLSTLPKRLMVIGGGPIGCELGQAFARFGSQVTIVESGKRLLGKDDAELGPLLQKAFEREGITVQLNTKARKVSQVADGKQVELEQEDGSTVTVVVDEILVSIGRQPTLKEMGLDVAGVEYDANKGIKVDDYLRTTNPRIYACGDVIGRYQFTHMAGAEAGMVIRNALFPLASKMSYDIVPWATFTDPEVAHVGLNEAEAREKYGSKLNVYRLPWQNNDRARTESDTIGFTKILTVGLRDKIVGGHIIGQGAGDLISEIIVAMSQGAGISAISGPIHVYPTRALGIRNTAQKAPLRFVEHPLTQKILRTYMRLTRPKA